jgi:hypothetical protein
MISKIEITEAILAAKAKKEPSGVNWLVLSGYQRSLLLLPVWVKIHFQKQKLKH